MTEPGGAWSQRWRHGQHSWRHRSDGGLDRYRYDVARIDERVAKDYVVTHHYSKTFPATAGGHRYGLFEDGQLAGVAVLGVPMQERVLTNVFPDLTANLEALELSRLVLDDAVPGNGESLFLTQVFAQAAQHGLRGVVSFSDPVPRQRSDGTLVMPGHVGICYQACNAFYLQRGTARNLIVLGDGTVLTARAAQKVRGVEQGHEYVERRLMSLGASAPQAGQRGADWLRTALDAVGARRVRHPGPHRYAFALGSPAERRRLRISGERGPYPKTIDRGSEIHP